MDELNINKKLLKTGPELKSRVARENYHRCLNNKTWVRFSNNPEVGNLFLGRIAKRYSPITRSDLYAAKPGGWGEFFTEDEKLAEGFYWKNGAVILIGEDYEVFVHLQDAQKWKLVDDAK